MTRTLLLILAALTLMIGSFIWFVATWDADQEQPIGFIGPQTGLRAAVPMAKIDPYQTHTGPIPTPYGVL